MIFVIIACQINPQLSILWFALWSIAIFISSSPIHEIGHAIAAKRCSRNINTLIGFWHIKHVGIDHVDSKHKKLIVLAGAAFGEIYVLLFMFLIWLFYYANGISMLTACIIAFVAFTLLNILRTFSCIKIDEMMVIISFILMKLRMKNFNKNPRFIGILSWFTVFD